MNMITEATKWEKLTVEDVLIYARLGREMYVDGDRKEIVTIILDFFD